MNILLIFSTILYLCFKFCSADCDNLQDTCPTAPGQSTIFINGFPCKNPAQVSASDFKSSELNQPGKSDKYVRSSFQLLTALELPGLNTLGLATSRIDIEADGLVIPHWHPRATEMLYVSKGLVVAGFIDTKSNLFQKSLKEGDVFVVPRGLLHFCFNAGYEAAIVFSFYNSQNPGVVKLGGDALFENNEVVIDEIVTKIMSVSGMEIRSSRNGTLFGF